MMQKKKVLVIDDEVQLVRILQLQLESSGYEVLTSYDGETALNKVKETTPDIIILDLMLPGLSGYMVCSLLKSDKRFEQIPVIMCTARTSDDDVKLGEKVGCDAYVMKPFEIQVLLDKIEELLYKNIS